MYLSLDSMLQKALENYKITFGLSKIAFNYFTLYRFIFPSIYAVVLKTDALFYFDHSTTTKLISQYSYVTNLDKKE